MNATKIKEWLDKMGIRNYHINDDLTVDVDDYVSLSNVRITKIPIQFGKVNGYFDCSENKLTTLKGCPSKVGNSFYCNNNYLTSLKNIPKDIGGYCILNNNNFPDELTDIEYDMLLTIIKHQDEYGIWNSDESFNKARWEFLYKDFCDGILTDE